MKNFLRVFKIAEITEEGVTSMWMWRCQHYECMYRTSDHGTSLFWENALKGANYHIRWHQVWQGKRAYL